MGLATTTIEERQAMVLGISLNTLTDEEFYALYRATKTVVRRHIDRLEELVGLRDWGHLDPHHSAELEHEYLWLKSVASRVLIVPRKDN